MEEVITIRKESVQGAPRRSSPESHEEREMNECLARLNVWQTENLMAPHGMDAFAKRPEKNR